MTQAVIDPKDPYAAQLLGSESGGPGTEGDSIHHAGEATPPATPPKVLYKTFGREFESADDLVEYTKEMERQTVESRLAAERLGVNRSQTTLQTQATPTPVITEGPSIDELLFTDPKKAVSMLRQQAKDDVMGEIGKKENEKKYWGNFYEENPDLRNADLVVQSITREKWTEISNLPLAEASKVIAREARKHVEKIRGLSDGTRTELARTTASALPASGGNPPKVAGVQEAPETFTEQLLKLRRGRKR